MEKKETFYKNLKEKLEDNTSFPTDYLYKFIVPTTKNQEKEIEDVFKGSNAKITKKSSRSTKFTSVSILLKVKSADEIIKNYKSVEGIEGIISL